MSFDYIAWHVRSSGDVRISDHGVSSSYGRPISPYTSTVDRGGAWGVMTYGDLINGYNIVYVYSYGRKIADHELLSRRLES